MEASEAQSQPRRAGLFDFVRFTTSLFLFAVPRTHLPAPPRGLRGEGLRGRRFPPRAAARPSAPRAHSHGPAPRLCISRCCPGQTPAPSYFPPPRARPNGRVGLPYGTVPLKGPRVNVRVRVCVRACCTPAPACQAPRRALQPRRREPCRPTSACKSASAGSKALGM